MLTFARAAEIKHGMVDLEPADTSVLHRYCPFGPKDKLVIEVPAHLSMDNEYLMLREVQRFLDSPETRVLVLQGGATATVLRIKDDA